MVTPDLPAMPPSRSPWKRICHAGIHHQRHRRGCRGSAARSLRRSGRPQGPGCYGMYHPRSVKIRCGCMCGLLAARFHNLGFRIAGETLALMGDIARSGELAHLTPERVWKELERYWAAKIRRCSFRYCGIAEPSPSCSRSWIGCLECRPVRSGTRKLTPASTP